MVTKSKVGSGEFNAETRRAQRNAEKNLLLFRSAPLGGLCVSALIGGWL
jgi:hypothetical protein